MGKAGMFKKIQGIIPDAVTVLPVCRPGAAVGE